MAAFGRDTPIQALYLSDGIAPVPDRSIPRIRRGSPYVFVSKSRAVRPNDRDSIADKSRQSNRKLADLLSPNWKLASPRGSGHRTTRPATQSRNGSAICVHRSGRRRTRSRSFGPLRCSAAPGVVTASTPARNALDSGVPMRPAIKFRVHQAAAVSGRDDASVHRMGGAERQGRCNGCRRQHQGHHWPADGLALAERYQLQQHQLKNHWEELCARSHRPV